MNATMESHESICATLRETMKGTMLSVMNHVHPEAVEHDPVLLCAFVAHCPPEIRNAIGTLGSSLLPELQTPTKMRRTGTVRDTPGRYDIALLDSDQRSGAITQIKVCHHGSFDQLRGVSNFPWSPRGYIANLAWDIRTLLDGKLPQDMLRVSWAVSGARATASQGEIAALAGAMNRKVAADFELSEPEQIVDKETGWLRCEWASEGFSIFLAWYQPPLGDRSCFEAVWSHGADSKESRDV